MICQGTSAPRRRVGGRVRRVALARWLGGKAVQGFVDLSWGLPAAAPGQSRWSAPPVLRRCGGPTCRRRLQAPRRSTCAPSSRRRRSPSGTRSGPWPGRSACPARGGSLWHRRATQSQGRARQPAPVQGLAAPRPLVSQQEQPRRPQGAALAERLGSLQQQLRRLAAALAPCLGSRRQRRPLGPAAFAAPLDSRLRPRQLRPVAALEAPLGSRLRRLRRRPAAALGSRRRPAWQLLHLAGQPTALAPRLARPPGQPSLCLGRARGTTQAARHLAVAARPAGALAARLSAAHHLAAAPVSGCGSAVPLMSDAAAVTALTAAAALHECLVWAGRGPLMQGWGPACELPHHTRACRCTAAASAMLCRWVHQLARCASDLSPHAWPWLQALAAGLGARHLVPRLQVAAAAPLERALQRSRPSWLASPPRSAS